MSYNVFLDNIKVGFSNLETADPPMGVVTGKLHFNDKKFNYTFFSNYCKINAIKAEEIPEEKCISTRAIPNLKVYNQNGIEIRGIGCFIEGMDCEEYEITIIGIPHPFYEEEFPHHVIQ